MGAAQSLRAAAIFPSHLQRRGHTPHCGLCTTQSCRSASTLARFRRPRAPRQPAHNRCCRQFRTRSEKTDFRLSSEPRVLSSVFLLLTSSHPPRRPSVINGKLTSPIGVQPTCQLRSHDTFSTLATFLRRECLVRKKRLQLQVCARCI